MFKTASITLAVVMTLGASAQAQAQTQVPADSGNPTPTYRINVVSRTTRAVSYRQPQWGHKNQFSRHRFDAWRNRRSQSREQARGA